jgi:chromosome segregation ATPase
VTTLRETLRKDLTNEQLNSANGEAQRACAVLDAKNEVLQEETAPIDALQEEIGLRETANEELRVKIVEVQRSLSALTAEKMALEQAGRTTDWRCPIVSKRR